MSNDNGGGGGMVVLTAEQLRELVRQVLREERQAAPLPDYLDPHDVAALLKCTPETVTTYALRDGLPCVRVGKLRRFLRADVLAWLEERRSAPRAHKARAVEAMRNVRELKRQ